MKIHILHEIYDDGRSVVYGAYSSKKKAEGMLSFLIRSYQNDGMKYTNYLSRPHGNATMHSFDDDDYRYWIETRTVE